MSSVSRGFAKRASATVDRKILFAEHPCRVERHLHPVPVAEQGHALAPRPRARRCRLAGPPPDRGAPRPRPRPAGSAAPPGPSWAIAVRSMWTSIASSRGAITTTLGIGREVGDVEGPVVGGAVVADQAGPVHREGDVEALQGRRRG